MLIKRVYEVDPLCCPKCQGKMKVIAFLEPPQADVIEKILRGHQSAADQRYASVPIGGLWHASRPTPGRRRFRLRLPRAQPGGSRRATRTDVRRRRHVLQRVLIATLSPPTRPGSGDSASVPHTFARATPAQSPSARGLAGVLYPIRPSITPTSPRIWPQGSQREQAASHPAPSGYPLTPPFPAITIRAVGNQISYALCECQREGASDGRTTAATVRNPRSTRRRADTGTPSGNFCTRTASSSGEGSRYRL